MELATIGWIALGWFVMAIALSLAIGSFIRKVNETPGEDDLVFAASKQKVMRYMRNHKATKTRCDAVDSRVRELGKRAVNN
jgi:hypothetical protein